MDSDQSYIGGELGLFAQATNWKRYLRRQLGPFIRGEVLEVGAGMGGTTRYLFTDDCSHWTCLEPDPELAGQIGRQIADSEEIADKVTVVVDTVSSFAPQPRYDTILYIDVLEHIENDVGEMEASAELLRRDGHLIVVAPAHQWLFSPFDAAIGHYRRYTRRDLRKLTPAALTVRRLRYLDCVGLIASLGNRLLLRASMPSSRQIAVWDRLMIPLSRICDPATAYRLGKSVCGVWQRGVA